MKIHKELICLAIGYSILAAVTVAGLVGFLDTVDAIFSIPLFATGLILFAAGELVEKTPPAYLKLNVVMGLVTLIVSFFLIVHGITLNAQGWPSPDPHADTMQVGGGTFFAISWFWVLFSYIELPDSNERILVTLMLVLTELTTFLICCLWVGSEILLISLKRVVTVWVFPGHLFVIAILCMFLRMLREVNRSNKVKKRKREADQKK
jgi:hypothetical protein